MTTVTEGLNRQEIELPSWAFGNSGTRFKVFSQPGVPRSPEEKISDAAVVHKHTGVAPSVALHIPWDKVDDYAALSAHAHGNGIKIGNPKDVFLYGAGAFGVLSALDNSCPARS